MLDAARMNELLRRWALPLMVSVMAACTPHVEGGAGGSGGGTGCPAPTPGQCLPSDSCIDGLHQNGQASCEDGQWVCIEVPCGDCGKTILAADYDQSCASDADCAPVYEGNLCSACRCPNATVNQQALPAYDAALATVKPQEGEVCSCPFFGAPVCSAGKCVMPAP